MKQRKNQQQRCLNDPKTSNRIASKMIKLHSSQWTYLECLFELDLMVIKLPFLSKNQSRNLCSSASTLSCQLSFSSSFILFSCNQPAIPRKKLAPQSHPTLLSNHPEKYPPSFFSLAYPPKPKKISCPSFSFSPSYPHYPICNQLA